MISTLDTHELSRNSRRRASITAKPKPLLVP